MFIDKLNKILSEEFSDPDFEAPEPEESSAANINNHTFNEYMNKVNKHLIKICGMVSDDLPDYNYILDWEIGESPKFCAEQAYENTINSL